MFIQNLLFSRLSKGKYGYVQIYCIFLFLCAASLFGTIIAQVNEIVAHLTTKKKDLDEIFEGYLSVRPRQAFL